MNLEKWPTEKEVRLLTYVPLTIRITHTTFIMTELAF